MRKFAPAVIIASAAIVAPALVSSGDFPAAETQFIDILHQAKARWKNAGNDLQREEMPRERAQALCALSPVATNWKGKVQRIGTYLFDKFVSINVAVSPDITLRTEGDLNDYGSKIDRHSELFKSVYNLRIGERVVFSGRFVKGDRGECFNETSLTNDGSMTDPAFIFIFTEIRPE